MITCIQVKGLRPDSIVAFGPTFHGEGMIGWVEGLGWQSTHTFLDRVTNEQIKLWTPSDV